MAPKKKGGKGKGNGDDDGPDQGEMNGILEAHVDSLKQKIVLEQERQNNSQRKEDSIRAVELELDVEMEQHKQATRECIKSMTQTYNLMEKDLRKQITEQETLVS